MNNRDKVRTGLAPIYLPIYDALCSRLGSEWAPFYGFRSFELQDALFAVGRTTPGTIITNARGGESAHNYGCASDWTVWAEDGEPIWLKPTDTKWKEFDDACIAARGQWGGLFKNPDCPHVQLQLKVAWKEVRGVFVAQGLPAAMDYVSAQKEN